MGNINSFIEKRKYDNILKRRCPYCKYTLPSIKEKKKHIKNCVYNNEINESEFNIYSCDPFKL